MAVQQSMLVTGFEHGQFVSGSNKIFSASAGSPAINGTSARNGSYGLKIAATAALCNATQVVDGPSGSAAQMGCFYVNFQTFWNANQAILCLRSGSGAVAAGFEFNSSTNKIRPYVRDELNNVDYTGTDCSISLSTNVWYRIDFLHTRPTTTSRKIEWYISVGDAAAGSAETALTSGAVTTSSYLASVTYGELLDRGNTATGEMWFDDVCILDYNALNTPTHPLGPSKTAVFVPVGDGTHSTAADFTDNAANSPPASVYDRLDEVPQGNTTSDYVYQDTGGAPSTSYLEVTMSATPSDWGAGVVANGGVHRGGFYVAAAGTSATSTCKIRDPANSVDLGSTIGTNGTIAGFKWGMNQIAPNAGTSANYNKAAFDQFRMRFGYASSTDVSPAVNLENYIWEVAYPPGASDNDGWGWGDGQERWAYV